ncbi:hypothetical protein CXX78_01320 [Candidatus Parvarchaeota archaeon]|nr:MAG: hypothetical protein CXX78_01320 [Candidatus Parvarchaeota archaeon]
MVKISSRIIFEIMGRPPEHISEALNTLVVKLGSEKGVEVINKKYHDVKKVEDADNLFHTFAEVEADFSDLNSFFGIIFNYMPANIEIFNPDKLKINNDELNQLSNFILTKLHQYDSIAKKLMGEREIMINQIRALKGEIPIVKAPIGKKETKKKKAKSSSKKAKRKVNK